MSLEKILEHTKRGVLIKAALSSIFVFGGCDLSIPSPEEVVITEPVTVDFPNVGAISGKVLVPKKQDNEIVYINYGDEGTLGGDTDSKNAHVWAVDKEGKEYKTTTTQGAYSIDGLPVGVYTIIADNDFYLMEEDAPPYKRDQKTAIVEKQKTTQVEDLRLKTHYESNKHVLYGKIYDFDNNPYANKEILVYEDGRIYNPLDSTITSSDGSYALYTGGKGYNGPDPRLVFRGSEEFFINGKWSVLAFKFNEEDAQYNDDEKLSISKIREGGPLYIEAYASRYVPRNE
ncbi:hypothetical protein DRN69_03110 [Candidatus Pacearchaeota archaeon]|nr:MAG: hypothetical protein DRN69_03110 [Candidatus Pacearchaeota archaeon]